MRIIQRWQVIIICTIAAVFASARVFNHPLLLNNSNQDDWTQEAAEFQGKIVELTGQAEPITPTPQSTQAPLKVLVAGDLMFDRHIRQHAQEQGNDFIFKPIASFLQSADYVVANLEGPITSFDSKSLGSIVGSPNNYLFTFPDSLPQTLVDHHITVVSLGNNHILNFGQAGLEQTLAHLETNMIQFFGHVSQTDRLVPISLVKTDKDITIAWINYNQFSAQPKQSVLEEIARLRESVDYVVVYAHWDNEYQPRPAAPTVALAHSMIDAGADMVIGSHPHVVQIREEYEGKQIYYSLGNFIFDQYFEPAVKNGMVLELLFDMNMKQISIKEHRIELLSNGQTRLLNTVE